MVEIRSNLSASLLILLFPWSCVHSEPLQTGTQVRGWTILSRNEEAEHLTISSASRYNINHLELSHEVVHNLNEIKDDTRDALVNRLIDAAHRAGIQEVVLWDHALYELDYYPKEFCSGPNGTLDLDNPEFWRWLKADYRSMLDRVPEVDGIVLTFIETGARAERQFSTKLITPAEKIAAVVNAVADVVIGERHLNLYARTFSYTRSEYDNIFKAIARFSRPEIRLMMKETPHDFFITHPDDPYVGSVPRPTLVEFDAAGEFNGEAIIAGTWPEYILRRWRRFALSPHFIGYTARTDRYGDTHLVGRPEEINLYTLKRATEDLQVTAEQMYDEFISMRYGSSAVPELKPAFKAAYEIVTSTLYTLGTNVTSHSGLDYDTVVPYYGSIPSYVLHVSGKWLDPPIVYVRHGIDREFYYWRDVVDHLAPDFVKVPESPWWAEVPEVGKRNWIHPGEAMDEAFLQYVLTEKSYGVAQAEAALRHIEAARGVLKDEDYKDLHAHFERTLLTARLRRATASVYFGSRVARRGKPFRTAKVLQTINDGKQETREVVKLIRAYPIKPPVGQWNWVKDTDAAERYLRDSEASIQTH